MKYKYIEIKKTQIGNIKRKTDIFTIKNIKSECVIGLIKWYPQWRQYCFFPGYNTVYSKGCLDDISDFLEQLKLKKKINE